MRIPHVFLASWPAVALLCGGCASAPTGRARDAHLLWGRPAEGRKISGARKAGPFWEEVRTEDGARRESWRPLLHTRVEAAEPGVALSEWLWPLYSRSERAGQTAWRFLIFSGMEKDASGETSPQDRTWLFPFWFSGTAKTGEDYAALFPLGGTIREMYYDRISFALFPLWATWDRNGNHTWSALWPIVQRQTGPRRDATRIFPLWGRSKFDGHYDASFVLWPFWTQAEHVGVNPGSDWMLWPLAGHVSRADENAWYVLPPFFSHASGRGKTPEYRKTWAPWPLVLLRDDEDAHARRFFPFYGRRWREDGKASLRVVLWPFWSDRQSVTRTRRVSEWSLFPVFHASTAERADESAPGGYALEERYVRAWPFWSRRYDPARRYTRIPDFSFQKREGPLERNLLGMFTLYTRGENTGADGAPRRVDREWLWGLFRDGEGGDGEWNWSLFGGLLGRSGRAGGPSRWRVLWLFGSAED